MSKFKLVDIVNKLAEDISNEESGQNLLQLEFLLLQLELVDVVNHLTDPEIKGVDSAYLAERTVPLMEKVMNLYKRVVSIPNSEINKLYNSKEVADIESDFNIVMSTMSRIAFSQKPGEA